MTIRVRLFASYADAIGSSEIALDLPAGSRVRDVVASVKALSTRKALPDRPMVAVNHRYAAENDVVSPSDEVAIIPPVAGG